MKKWQSLIQQMSKFGRLSESCKVADDSIAAMTAPMKREALRYFITAYVEEQIRARTRAIEAASELAASKIEAERCRQRLSQRHGRDFATIEEANAYDDDVVLKSVREKREAEERRREEIGKSLLEQLHVRWSAELLESGIKLGDGSFTTWGAATILQHEARIRMLMGNVTGNIDTMKRHEAAVIALTGSGAACLNEVRWQDNLDG